MNLFHTRQGKTQARVSAVTVPFRVVSRSLAQRYDRTNHFEKLPFPACRLQYTHRGRKLVTGPNVKPVFHNSVSTQHAHSSVLLPRGRVPRSAATPGQELMTATGSSSTDGVWQGRMISQRTLHLSPCSAAEPDLASSKEAPAD